MVTRPYSNITVGSRSAPGEHRQLRIADGLLKASPLFREEGGGLELREYDVAVQMQLSILATKGAVCFSVGNNRERFDSSANPKLLVAASRLDTSIVLELSG